MAKLVATPIEPPAWESYMVDGHFNYERHRQLTGAYIAQLEQLSAGNGSSKLLGEVLRFQRGDGYAMYMVWRTRPLELIHLPVDDAWQVEDALIRGLRLSDIKDMVDCEEKLKELFVSRNGERSGRA